jgi:trigger factor
MQFTLTTTSGLERRIEVAIPHTRVAGEVERRLRELSRTANIRGFRPGKVPMNVIKRQFGGQVHGDTVTELIRETYSEAVTKENLRPAGGPRIEPIQLEPGDDLKFAAVFEVLPEVTVKPVTDLAIERTTVDISEADVDAMIESMRRQRVDYRKVERASQTGDRVLVDFVGRLDGVPFPGGTGEDTPFVLGSGRAIADFEAALTGMSAGETKTAPVTFPENYGAKDLAGKQTEFDLTVKEVQEEFLPPVDDEFATAFGIQEGGVDRLREEVRKSMEREAGEAIRTRLRTQVFDALQKDNPVELPKALVDEQVEQLQLDAMQRMGIKDAAQAPARGSLRGAGPPPRPPGPHRRRTHPPRGPQGRPGAQLPAPERALRRVPESGGGAACVPAEPGRDAPDRDVGPGRPGRGLGRSQRACDGSPGQLRRTHRLRPAGVG